MYSLLLLERKNIIPLQFFPPIIKLIMLHGFNLKFVGRIYHANLLFQSHIAWFHLSRLNFNILTNFSPLVVDMLTNILRCPIWIAQKCTISRLPYLKTMCYMLKFLLLKFGTHSNCIFKTNLWETTISRSTLCITNIVILKILHYILSTVYFNL